MIKYLYSFAAQMYEEGIANMRSAILDRQPDLSALALAREMRHRLLPRALFHQVEAYVNERTIRQQALDR